MNKQEAIKTVGLDKVESLEKGQIDSGSVCLPGHLADQTEFGAFVRLADGQTLQFKFYVPTSVVDTCEDPADIDFSGWINDAEYEIF